MSKNQGLSAWQIAAILRGETITTRDPELNKQLKQHAENKAYDAVVDTLKFLHGGK